MIFQIETPVSDVSGVINYHESKVSEGKATKVYSNLLTDDPEEMVETFNDSFLTNNRVYKNKAYHISANFDTSASHLNENEKLKIVFDYINEMKLSDRDTIIYRHHDANHDHFHLILNSIDFDAKKYNEWNMKVKNTEITRALEKKYKLRVLNNIGESEVSNLMSQDKATEAYKLARALTQVDKQKLPIVDHLLDKHQIKEFQDLKDSQIRYIFTKKHKMDQYRELFQILNDNGLIQYSLKEQLTKFLKEQRKEASSMEDFILRTNTDKFYSRKLHKSGSYHMVYGFKDKSYYFEESKLGPIFSHDDLTKYYKNNKETTTDKLKYHVALKVKDILAQSTSLDEFEKNLKSNNIKPDFNKNASGITGISFIISSADNTLRYKGSNLTKDRSLSYVRILKQLDHNKKHEESKREAQRIITDILNSRKTHSYTTFKALLEQDGVKIYFDRKTRERRLNIGYNGIDYNHPLREIDDMKNIIDQLRKIKADRKKKNTKAAIKKPYIPKPSFARTAGSLAQIFEEQQEATEQDEYLREFGLS